MIFWFVLLISIYPLLLLYAYIEERIRLKNIKSKFIKYDQDLKEFSIKCNIPYSFFKEINDLGHCIVLEKKKSDCSFIPKVAVVEFDKHKIKRSSIEEIAQKYNLSLYNTSSELLGNAILVSSVKEYNDLINLFGLKDANNLSYEKSLDEIIKKHSNSLKPIVKGIDEDYIEIAFGKSINSVVADSFAEDLIKICPAILEFQSKKEISKKIVEDKLIYIPLSLE